VNYPIMWGLLWRELPAIPRAEDNQVAAVLANRVDSPCPGGSVAIPPNGFPIWDIHVVAPRVLALGTVMPRHIDLAVCRQKLMIPKVDMFANRLVEAYAPVVAAKSRSMLPVNCEYQEWVPYCVREAGCLRRQRWRRLRRWRVTIGMT
jgi:hypothetical protein